MKYSSIISYVYHIRHTIISFICILFRQNITATSIEEHHNNVVDFDLYVMSMSYQPEFCYKNRHKIDHFPGCLHPQEYWKGHLTIHGLWPQYANNSWPSNCRSDEPLQNSTIIALHNALEHFWPNVKATKPTMEHYKDFWSHEWLKHGTCSGLTQMAYFEAAINHFIPTPSLISESYGKFVDKQSFYQAYNDISSSDDDDIIVTCTGHKYLSEVRVCLGTEKDGSPTHRIPCPKTIDAAEDSCVGDKIYISKFPVEFIESEFIS